MRYPVTGAVPAAAATKRRTRAATTSMSAANAQMADPGVASYFVWMRRHTGLSIHQTAALLQTEAEVISALEAGAVMELPVWPETARIVQAYAALAGVDAAAAINALYASWPPANGSGNSAALRQSKTAKIQSVAEGKLKRMKSAMAARGAGRLSFKLW